MMQSSKDSVGTVIACWNQRKNVKWHEVKVGDGELVCRLKHSYTDAKGVQVAAQSALDTANVVRKL